ncbi:MAG: hypothetical protein AAF490_20760 [Chloroflexota bacterium]
MIVLRKYYVLEILLAVIAVVSLATAVYNTFSPSGVAETAVVASNAPALVAEQSPIELQDVSPPIFDEDEDEEDEANENLSFNEDIDEADDTNANEFEDDADESEENEPEDDGEEEDEDPFALVLSQFGLEVDTVDEQRLQGHSLAEIAQAQGVDVQALINELVKLEEQYIQEELQAGELSAADAEGERQFLANEIAFWVNTPYLEPEIIAAQVLGLDLEAVWDALESGQTLATLAQSQGVEPQAVIDAIIVSEISNVREMVKADLIGASELNELEAEILQSTESFVMNGEISEDEEDFDE